MYSTATTTTPAVASFMTGCYSEKNGINSLKQAKLQPEVPTIAEKLKQKGYNTNALVTGPLSDQTDLDRGFDRYEIRGPQKDLFSDWEEELRSQIEDLEQDFFLFLHLWEIHGKVEVPEKFDYEKYGETPYARALSALDRKIEILVDKMPEDTAIVVHGDHGESISRRNSFLRNNLKKVRTFLRYYKGIDTRRFERALNRAVDKIAPSKLKDHFLEAGHGENIYDFTTNVPFIINGAGVEGQEVFEQVRQIDIFPTILELADTGISKDVDGESLLQNDLEDRTAYMRACGTSLKTEKNWSRGIRTGDWKYISFPNRDWKPELYNLKKDPKELRDLKDKEKRAGMREKLPKKELLRSESLEIKDKLKELGYL